MTVSREYRYTPAKTQEEKEDDLLNQLDPFYDAEDEALLDKLRTKTRTTDVITQTMAK